MNTLHPLHLEDLRKSGLSDETIIKADFQSVSPDLINKRIGFNIPGLISMYAIPYPKTDFSRYRVFYENGKESYTTGKRKPKYIQHRNTGNRLYIPHAIIPVLNDTHIDLYLTEGEKKALKATQEGIYCIGLSGLWNWSNGNKELIPDFNRIILEGRTVYIVPDSDWLHPNKHGYEKNLKQAVYQLADRLRKKGARVLIVFLPEGE